MITYLKPIEERFQMPVTIQTIWVHNTVLVQQLIDGKIRESRLEKVAIIGHGG